MDNFEISFLKYLIDISIGLNTLWREGFINSNVTFVISQVVVSLDNMIIGSEIISGQWT